MSIPSQQYVALYQLQQLIIEDSLSEAAAGGVVSFYEDSNRTVPKDVYELAGNFSSGYTFNNIGSTITLGSAGTFVDESGNDFIVYVYPYDTNGNLQLYYVTIYGSDGTLILTREAVPANVQYISPASSTSSAETGNAISNPQFSEVNFQPAGSPGITISVTGSSTVSSVIPDWDIVTSGSGTVTVYQLPTSDGNIPTNPPYLLDIVSSGISNIQLQQTLAASPSVFYGSQVSFSFVGYVSGGGTANCTAIYQPSNSSDTAYTVPVTISGSTYTQYYVTFTVTGTENTDTAPAGNVTIQLVMPVSSHLRLSSFQLVIVPLESSQPAYLQEPVARQQDHLFHYWQPKLNFKAIPSYTIGWDFAFNPCQPLGTLVGPNSTLSANQAWYIADQTIAFESVQQVMKYNFSGTTQAGFASAYPGIQATTTSTTTQFALIQYLDAETAQEILSQSNSIKIKGSVTSGSLGATVGMYYTTNSGPAITALPSTFFSSLTAGVPTTLASGWTQVSRGAYPATQAITFTTTEQTFDIPWFNTKFSGPNTTATGIAIVIGFNAITSAQILQMSYASCVPGDIPSPPAPLSNVQTLAALQAYYEQSFPIGAASAVLPSNLGTQDARAAITTNGTSTMYVWACDFNVNYKMPKRVVPTFTMYSPVTGTANRLNVLGLGIVGTSLSVQQTDIVYSTFFNSNLSTQSNWVSITSTGLSAYITSLSYGGTVTVTSPAFFSFQYIADARFGVV